MKRLAASIVCFLACSSFCGVFAQSPSAASTEANPAIEEPAPRNETETAAVQSQLFKFLRTSPRLTMAISNDPALLGYQEYVNRHNPDLAAFIRRHPEIARNPEFYLFSNLPGGGNGERVPNLFQRAVWPEIGRRSGSNYNDLVFAAIMGIVIPGAIIWLLRMLLQNRRWNRVFKVQTEMHSKLLDKLGGNQELFTYLGSDAGRRFLELAPVAAALESSRPSGPFSSINRILAPLQFGVVSTMIGIGFLSLGWYYKDATGGTIVFGTLALMVGIGLMLSAGLSWAMARRFGLLSDNNDATRES